MAKDYISPLANELRNKFNETQLPQKGVDVLFRYYALMALTKGKATTSEDVHNCWTLWALQFDPDNKSILPYSELDAETQRLDDIFVQAIRDGAMSVMLNITNKRKARPWMSEIQKK